MEHVPERLLRWAAEHYVSVSALVGAAAWCIWQGLAYYRARRRLERVFTEEALSRAVKLREAARAAEKDWPR